MQNKAHSSSAAVQVQDLVSWNHDMKETLWSEEPARSLSGAEPLILKYDEHKAEIEARDDSVVEVTKAGRKLIHYASAEVQPHYQLTNRISQTSIDIVHVHVHAKCTTEA